MENAKLKKNKPSLLQNIVRVLSANFWIAIVGFIGSFIFPRILSVDDYALYHTFTLYLGYIAITHLGFPSGMAINYAGKDYNSIERKQYRAEMTILMGILLFFTAVFTVFAIVLKNRMIVYVALAVVPTGLIGSYKSLLQSWSRFKFFSRLSTMLATFVPGAALIYYLITHKLPGDVYIQIYLLVYWGVTIYILIDIAKKIRGEETGKLFSKQNWNTEKTGIALLLGNYINVLFTSSDKQFVKWFFTNAEFAYYSFGMSMQTLMTVFITSISQPLFPAMAQGKFKDEEYTKLKDLLFVFGAFSGCAYFAVSFIVKNFIQKYIDSLQVVGIYFVVFPVMAVITCLYINLYKIKGLMVTYIKTLAGILIVAVFLNTVFVYTYGHFTGVAIATTLTYYIWFFIGLTQFKFIKLKPKDLIYLVVYSIVFFSIIKISNDIIGFFVYLVIILALDFIIYRKEVSHYIGLVRRK